MGGSNNPTGLDLEEKDTIPFHPYYTSKDMLGLGLFLLFWMFFVFFKPNFFGEADNYIPANPLSTPEHIVPEWYFLPFYAILRSVPDKLSGVMLMFGSILVLFVVPWLDSSKIRSANYRPLYRIFYGLFLISCLSLGWAGGQAPEGIPLIVSRIATAYYFVFFLLVMPLLGRFEISVPLPSMDKLKSLIIVTMCVSSVSIASSSNANANNSNVIPKQNWGFESL